MLEGGAGLITATPLGSFGLHGATSASDLGFGYGASINWDLVNFNGVIGALSGARESLRLSAEYRSTEFRTPGEFVTTASGILYPQVPYWLRFSGSYSVPIGWGATASLAARYSSSTPTSSRSRRSSWKATATGPNWRSRTRSDKR